MLKFRTLMFLTATFTLNVFVEDIYALDKAAAPSSVGIDQLNATSSSSASSIPASTPFQSISSLKDSPAFLDGIMRKYPKASLHIFLDFDETMADFEHKITLEKDNGEQDTAAAAATTSTEQTKKTYRFLFLCSSERSRQLQPVLKATTEKLFPGNFHQAWNIIRSMFSSREKYLEKYTYNELCDVLKRRGYVSEENNFRFVDDLPNTIAELKKRKIGLKVLSAKPANTQRLTVLKQVGLEEGDYIYSDKKDGAIFDYILMLKEKQTDVKNPYLAVLIDNYPEGDRFQNQSEVDKEFLEGVGMLKQVPHLKDLELDCLYIRDSRFEILINGPAKPLIAKEIYSAVELHIKLLNLFGRIKTQDLLNKKKEYDALLAKNEEEVENFEDDKFDLDENIGNLEKEIKAIKAKENEYRELMTIWPKSS